MTLGTFVGTIILKTTIFELCRSCGKQTKLTHTMQSEYIIILRLKATWQ